MTLRRITAPPVTPVTLAEAKEHLRIINDTSSDAEIARMIGEAATFVEELTNRALVEQVWELVLDEFPTDAVQIPLPPLIAVISVSYLDDNGDTQTLVENTDYVVDTLLGWIVLPDGESWPTTYEAINAVTIRFRAGYSSGSPIDGEGVPAPVRRAILLLVGFWFGAREVVNIGNITSVLPFTVEALLSPYRIWR